MSFPKHLNLTYESQWVLKEHLIRSCLNGWVWKDARIIGVMKGYCESKRERMSHHERVLMSVPFTARPATYPLQSHRHASYIRVVRKDARIRGVMKGYCGSKRHERIYHHVWVWKDVLIRGYMSSLPIRRSPHYVSSAIYSILLQIHLMTHLIVVACHYWSTDPPLPLCHQNT